MVKIKRIFKLFSLSIILLILFLNIGIVKANDTRVFDEANLFTIEEIQDLETRAERIALEHSIDMIIVTIDDAKGKSSRDYADDYYDSNNFGFNGSKDGILFLIDMDNRETYISTSGEAIKYLTDERIESIIQLVISSGLKDENFYGASLGFLKGSENYLEMGIPQGQYSEDEDVKAKKSLSLVDSLIGVSGGLLSSVLFFFRTKSKYKMKNPVKPVTFRNNSVFNMDKEENRLFDTKVVHKPIQKAKSESNKSTTHTSSSGETHGGGGTKF